MGNILDDDDIKEIKQATEQVTNIGMDVLVKILTSRSYELAEALIHFKTALFERGFTDEEAIRIVLAYMESSKVSKK